MTLRRLLVGCGAVAVVAVAGFVPATATGSAAAKTICVGLVVDPHSIGGSVSDGCINVSPDASGLDVLDAAGHSLTFRKDGLLCTIDGLPESGCDDVDNNHYWAYFHRAPDRTVWSYSNEGAATYEPANRSTEGWVYDNGTSLKPQNIPAGQICAALLKPTPTPTAASPKPHPTRTAKASSAATAAPQPSPRHSYHYVRTTPKTPESVPPTPTELATDTATPAANSADSGGHGNATGALIAAGVIVVLIAGAAVGARRRSS